MDDNINTQTGQSGDLGGNAGQQPVTGFQQAGGNVQSPEVSWEDREKAFLAKAYQQAQSLVSKSENRQTSNVQGMIDQFKRDFGVTLTEQQAQEMAQNQAAKSLPNVQSVAQQTTQQVPATDPQYQGFMYYHGMTNDPNLTPLYRQMYDIQNTLGVQLEKGDPEYYKFTHPEQKYKKEEFVGAWRQACIEKMLRLQSTQPAQADGNNQQSTNLGQMPLVGSRGRKPNTYDDKRSAKSYFSQYIGEKKL